MVKAKAVNRISENGNGNGAHVEAPPADKTVTISAPNFQTAVFTIVGTAPYVQNKFSEKARQKMRAAQEAGEKRKKGAAREAKDFQECYEGALHVSTDGWYGIPAPGFRAAMISACRACGFQMTRAKLSVFVEADGHDATDGTPLVKITKGEPRPVEHLVRQNMTTDIRVRPMWSPGWQAVVRVRFDADQFALDDVANLLLRAGVQVGVGEGRPDSRASAGMGWGTFALADK